VLTNHFGAKRHEREGRRDDRRAGLSREETESVMLPLIEERRSEIADICAASASAGSP
jgi:hypothetical protein